MAGRLVLVHPLTVAVAALAAAAQAQVPQAPADGDPDRGAEVFLTCSGCHQVGRDADHGIGPHLNGIFDRKAAAHPDFPYSRSMARAGADGLAWTYRTLDAYLQNPRALVSRTRMNFAGLDDPADRADVMAYLRRFSADPQNIPEAAPTAVDAGHDLDPEILALEGDPEYGEYLSSECVTCHSAQGEDTGVPAITLWPEEDFVAAMHAYKRELRPHPVMQMVVSRCEKTVRKPTEISSEVLVQASR